MMSELPLPSLALLALALLAAATAAHYLFWTWRLRAPSTEDELVFADTADGWRLAMGHHRARPSDAGTRGAGERLPVLLVHGIAVNRGCMDFGVARWSLAAHLARAGFETFALDLRGHGASRRLRPDAPRSWGFDDYATLDLPAALDRVRALTGAERVAIVGHSQGGLLGMVACQLVPERVGALVALGAPAWFDVQDPHWILRRLFFVFMGRLNRFLARCAAPFAGYWHPPVSEIAINGRNVPRPVLQRVLANVVENVSPPVLAQFARWIASDTFASADGSVDYRAGLARCRQPALFVWAAADRLAPPRVVERAARAWGGPVELLGLGRDRHACADYGHSDLLFGKSAPEEVFTRVSAFLAALRAPAPGPRDPAAPRAARRPAGARP